VTEDEREDRFRRMLGLGVFAMLVLALSCCCVGGALVGATDDGHQQRGHHH
jgi:hypothetical protein